MRLRLIVKLIFIASAALPSSRSVLAETETIMHVASWLPPSHLQNSIVWPTYGSWIEAATEGRVKIKLEYGLGHPKSMFDLVEDGVVDASWSFHGYVPGRFKLTSIVELPMLGADAEAASVSYWRIHQKYLSKADEHNGLVLVALFTHGPAQIHTVEPIASLAELKDKKIRIGGGVQGYLAKRMQVTSVSAPADNIYEMMGQGLIDGAFIPFSVQKSLRLNELAKHIIALEGGMYLGSFSMFINPDFLASLSQRDRVAILKISGEKLSALAGYTWEKADQEGYQTALSTGAVINYVKKSDPIYREFVRLTKGMDKEWIDSVKDRGIDAEAALIELRDTARAYR
ncbi:TRAP-type C4-dicarboxylate transport system, substrate-binding protein [Neptunomonas antarctica]|uniref:TRAP-type C4-dicarboxylate transport system, substrate-binding protein n=1 Tax=Neptunomonas antarctica TaxID=619304 RepID=A0A1N7JFX8_9GAMM|nr:TRAP-type C4-dicarboxylate transport system, substrate-binding protein [Neptunomonas antarctica]